MASFRKHKNGWRAEVQRKGVRKSRLFPTKREAELWAAHVEFEVVNQKPAAQHFSVSDAFERYGREVSSEKGGARWEIIRLEKFKTYDIAHKMIGEVQASDIAAWRDARLGEVKPNTVRREMQLMSGVFNVARKEWGWITASPMVDVRRPKKPPPRNRRVKKGELEALAVSSGSDLKNRTARAFHAFLFAIETGMRASEILRLRQDDVTGRVARVNQSKTGLPRDVPLSREALRLWGDLPGGHFDLTSQQLDALWRKVRDRAGVDGLTFHDGRHEAITRLSRKLDVLALAKMVGHQDVRMLMTYYEASAEELADRLD